MKRSKFSDQQIAFILPQAEEGTRVDKSGRTVVIVAGPVRMGRGWCFADQERFLNRQLSLPVSMMSQ